MIPTKSENPTGLYQKYIVTKVSGKPLPIGSEYFVLRLDEVEPVNVEHINACRLAVLAYADAIANTKPEMSRDLYDKYNKAVGNDAQLKATPTL